METKRKTRRERGRETRSSPPLQVGLLDFRQVFFLRVLFDHDPRVGSEVQTEALVASRCGRSLFFKVV